jgi:hypothetical protein
MKLLEADHPFFKPLWRRVAVVAVCFGWAGFEYWTDNPGWAALFGFMGLIAGYQFFLAPKRKDTE